VFEALFALGRYQEAAETAQANADAYAQHKDAGRAALAQMNAGKALLAKRSYDDALTAYGKVITEFPTRTGEVAASRLGMARAYGQQKQWSEAASQLRQLLQENPERGHHNLQGHYQLGLILAASGDIAGAKAELQSVVDNYPDDVMAQRAKARLAKLE
jgi:TolA-binding protein